MPRYTPRTPRAGSHVTASGTFAASVDAARRFSAAARLLPLLRRLSIARMALFHAKITMRAE